MMFWNHLYARPIATGKFLVSTAAGLAAPRLAEQPWVVEACQLVGIAPGLPGLPGQCLCVGVGPNPAVSPAVPRSLVPAASPDAGQPARPKLIVCEVVLYLST
jgi:hypothetical protein